MYRIPVVAVAGLLLLGTAYAAEPTIADAQARLGARDYEAAAAILEALRDQRPEDAQATYLLGYARHALGDIRGALPLHEAAGKDASFRVSALFNQACAHALLGETDEAIAALGSAVAAGLKNTHATRSDPDLRLLRTDPRFEVLLPDPAGPGIEDDPRAFDFWVGDWTSVVRRKTKATWKISGALRHRVHAVLGGRVIVEYAEGVPPNSMMGFSARVFDSRTQRWTALLNWPGKNASAFSRMEGYVLHGRASFFAGAEPNLTRFTFSDTSPKRCRWDQATTKDGGVTWNTSMMFLFTRRPDDVAPFVVGPSRSTRRCDAPAFRSLDWVLGSWRSADAMAKARFRSVMEGSAIECSLALGSGDDAREVFAIAALDKRVGRWVWYQATSDHVRFVRLEGPTGVDSRVTLRGRREASPYRLRLHRAGDTLSILAEESSDGGRSWHARFETKLVRE